MLHIHRTKGHYIGQVRPVGCRKWITVARSQYCAHRALANAVLKGRGMKRARVLFIDHSGYYDPHLVMEARLD